jgi:hypothetical protein
VTLDPDHSATEPFGGSLDPGSRTLTYVYKAASEGSVSFTVTATAKYEDDTYVYPEPPDPPLTATSETVRVSNDTVPPVTVPDFPEPNGDNLWYKSPFTLTLSASDAAGDVQSIFYRVEALDSYTTTTTASTVDIPIESEGQTAVTFYAIDAAGNIEASRTMVFHLDTVPPTAGQVVVSPAASPNG